MTKICFFFNDTATTEIYTLSLHDALPIWFALSPDAGSSEPARRSDWSRTTVERVQSGMSRVSTAVLLVALTLAASDRKSTRLNSSHANISYAVFCLKKKQNPRFVYSVNIP